MGNRNTTTSNPAHDVVWSSLPEQLEMSVNRSSLGAWDDSLPELVDAEEHQTLQPPARLGCTGKASQPADVKALPAAVSPSAWTAAAATGQPSFCHQKDADQDLWR